MAFDTFDHFEHKLGSKVWPSDDLEDSPFDTFTCKHCGALKDLEMYGTMQIGDESFRKRARDVLQDHLSICSKFHVVPFTNTMK